MTTRGLLLGATGGTGKALVEEALQRGIGVTAYVRNPAKLGLTHPLLQVATGALSDGERLAEAIAGKDAVVSALGHVKGSPVDVLRAAADAVLAAMQKAGVRRLIAVSGAAVMVPGDAPPGFIQKGFVKALDLMMPGLSEDTQGYADKIRNSGLEWTLARPMMLKDGPGGKPVRAAADLKLGPTEGIQRKDLATFILDELAQGRFIQQAPKVAAG